MPSDSQPTPAAVEKIEADDPFCWVKTRVDAALEGVPTIAAVNSMLALHVRSLAEDALALLAAIIRRDNRIADLHSRLALGEKDTERMNWLDSRVDHQAADAYLRLEFATNVNLREAVDAELPHPSPTGEP